MALSDDPDEIDQKSRELTASRWAIFVNENAAAARISIMFEVYPELALRKLREAPEYFGPLRDDKVGVISQDFALRSSTALDIRERLREFRSAVEDQVVRENREPEREHEHRKKRRRERER